MPITHHTYAGPSQHEITRANNYCFRWPWHGLLAVFPIGNMRRRRPRVNAFLARRGWRIEISYDDLPAIF
jgi:hypothetical protein